MAASVFGKTTGNYSCEKIWARRLKGVEQRRDECKMSGVRLRPKKTFIKIIRPQIISARKCDGKCADSFVNTFQTDDAINIQLWRCQKNLAAMWFNDSVKHF